MLRVGSCFSGIGGLDLGLETAGGFRTVWFIENDPHCQKVLRRHWPDVPVFGDIQHVSASDLGTIDVLSGGYPCQPFSVAGKRKGADDARHLWGHMRRLVRILRPELVIIENVPGHISMGLVDVIADLAELRFDAEWGFISAADVGAPHLRKRLFIVAHACGGSVRDQSGRRHGQSRPRAGIAGHHGQKGGRATKPGVGLRSYGIPCGLDAARWPAPPGDDQHEWEPRRTCEGHTGRTDELKALGNAVVPQVAELLGRRILESLNDGRANA